jgi:hypothetical protein
MPPDCGSADASRHVAKGHDEVICFGISVANNHPAAVKSNANPREPVR